MHTLISMSIGFILFLYNLFLCDIDSIYTMFFLILLVILYGPRVCNRRLNNGLQCSGDDILCTSLYLMYITTEDCVKLSTGGYRNSFLRTWANDSQPVTF